ncbi:MAG: anthranilate phosphoribosyltransferase [Phycisphaeraceae bacterium]|nr:anthranilate phosphoribosyltransferase [Phycisphaeraceae bacterium]
MHSLLTQLVAGRTLTAQQAAEVFEQIMSGSAEPTQTAALLAMMQMRGPTVDEIVGAARVMRSKVAAVAVPTGLRVIDTCGTGGDHTPTFNISTAAAIVVAAVARPRGVAVAKHGNKTVTRTSGSSQGLEALGVRLVSEPAMLTRCLDEVGICFCYAPAHHPAMKYAAAVRAELGFRTIFNLLGPLSNPAAAVAQLLGVAQTDLTERLARALRDLGCRHAILVHGYCDDQRTAGFCELSICGPTRVTELVGENIDTAELDANDLGLPRAKLESLLVKDPAQSAAVIQEVLSGETGPARDVVLLNAAAALRVADLAADWSEGLQLAAAAIDRGDARQVLAKLIAVTQADGKGSA